MTIDKKNAFGLMAPKGSEFVMTRRCGEKQQVWWQTRKQRAHILNHSLNHGEQTADAVSV